MFTSNLNTTYNIGALLIFVGFFFFRGSYPPISPKYSYDLRGLIAQLFKRVPKYVSSCFVYHVTSDILTA